MSIYLLQNVSLLDQDSVLNNNIERNQIGLKVGTKLNDSGHYETFFAAFALFKYEINVCIILGTLFYHINAQVQGSGDASLIWKRSFWPFRAV